MFADSNAAVYAAVITAVVVSVLAPYVNGRVQERKAKIESELRRKEARDEAELARQERRKDLEDVRLATLAAKAEAKQSADLARQEAAEHADRLIAQQQVQQAALLESNLAIAAATEMTTAEQAVIKKEISEVKDIGIITHALVNSDKTSSMKRQKVSFAAQRAALDATLRLTEQLSMANGVKINEGVQSSFDVIAEQIRMLDIEIATLDDEIEARLAEQHRAERQVDMSAGYVTGSIPITITNATITVAEAKPLEVLHVDPTHE